MEVSALGAKPYAMQASTLGNPSKQGLGYSHVSYLVFARKA